MGVERCHENECDIASATGSFTIPVPVNEGAQPMKYRTASNDVLMDQKIMGRVCLGTIILGRERARMRAGAMRDGDGRSGSGRESSNSEPDRIGVFTTASKPGRTPDGHSTPRPTTHHSEIRSKLSQTRSHTALKPPDRLVPRESSPFSGCLSCRVWASERRAVVPGV